MTDTANVAVVDPQSLGFKWAIGMTAPNGETDAISDPNRDQRVPA